MVQKFLCSWAVAICLIYAVSGIPSRRFSGQAEFELTSEEERNLSRCLRSHNISQMARKSNDEVDIKKVSDIVTECLSQIPAFKPVVLAFNVLNYFIENNSTRQGICGIPKNTENQEIRRLFKRLERISSDKDSEFCSLTTEEFLPELCKLKTFCTKDKKEIDLAFAVFYATHQLTDHHPEPYSCKDESGKEILGSIINPAAYTDDFDVFHDRILTKPLPCNAGKSESSSSSSRSSLRSPSARLSMDEVVKPAMRMMSDTLRF